MKARLKILVTGSNGFIGSKIIENLDPKKYEVLRLQKNFEPGVLNCDLLDADQAKKILGNLGHIDLLIHTAAIAHGQKQRKTHVDNSVNVRITKNLINSLGDSVSKAIFLSSISVCGLNLFSSSDFLSIYTQPVSDYDREKLFCEELFLRGLFDEVHILRLSPVFDESNLTDVSKRVIFPGMRNFKISIIPSPYYSFLHVSNLVDYVYNLTLVNNGGFWLHNLSDNKPYSQRKISNWFKGISIPIPLFLTFPLYCVSELLPYPIKQKFRESYIKLFKARYIKPGKIRLVN